MRARLPTRGFLGRGGAGDRLDRAGEKSLRPFDGLYGRWFAGGVVNTCYNALDRHVAGGRADQVALIHDSPLANPAQASTVTKFTYAELLAEVRTLAAIMQDFGVAKGDRVILYMPMVPEAVIAMLACARIARCIRWCSAVLRRKNSPPALKMQNRN